MAEGDDGGSDDDDSRAHDRHNIHRETIHKTIIPRPNACKADFSMARGRLLFAPRQNVGSLGYLFRRAIAPSRGLSRNIHT